MPSWAEMSTSFRVPRVMGIRIAPLWPSQARALRASMRMNRSGYESQDVRFGWQEISHSQVRLKCWQSEQVVLGGNSRVAYTERPSGQTSVSGVCRSLERPQRTQPRLESLTSDGIRIAP